MSAPRSRLIVPLVLLGALSGTAAAQSAGSGGLADTRASRSAGSREAGAAAPAGAAADMHPSVGMALANLQIELNALNTMNDAASIQLSQAEARQRLMSDFIASRKLTDALRTFTDSWKPQSAPLSFQQAYQAAIRTEQLRGAVTPSSNDIDTLANEVAASTTMVQSQWNRLNAQLGQTEALAHFIAQRNLMNEYHDFAAKNAAAVKAELDARADRQAQLQREREARHDQRRAAALAHLQKQWDSESHMNNSGINYNYQFSQGASQASEFSQTPVTAYTAGTGQNPAISQNVYAPPGPIAYDYWTGTTFNGYADPYYDLNGWPAGVPAAANAAEAYRRANAMRSSAPPPSMR